MNNLYDYLAPLFSDGDVLKKIIGALIILILGFMIAAFLKRMVRNLILKLNIGKGGEVNQRSLANTVGKLTYYLIMTYVLLLVLNILGFSNVLGPLEDMLSKITNFLPNVAVGGLIGFVGYTLANIAREAVGLFSGSLDSFSEKLGVTGSMSISKLLRQLVFLVIFVPIAILALDALQMKAISEPASEMLSTMMNSIPNILAAALILIVFFVFGRFVIAILQDLLRNLGVDDLPAKMGISSVLSSGMTLSTLLGKIAFFFLMFSASIAAVDKLEFIQFGDILRSLFDLTGRIFLGLGILIIGNFISNIVARYMNGTGAEGLATLVRFATLGLFLAIALRTMGIADDIVNLAFGLILGAVAVAFALSFGLGGREAAGRQMEHWLSRFRD